MIRKIILAVVLTAGTAMLLRAQENGPGFYKKAPGRTELTFNMYDQWINHRHVAWLGSGNIMSVELTAYSNYALLQDIEALLAGVKADLAFVADSIKECPQCNYRVDYVATPSGMKNYRIRKYTPQGTFLYQKAGSELKPFKPEPDTLHLLIYGPPVARPGYTERFQINFVLNRLGNLDTLLAQKGRLNSIIDTFRKRSAPRYGPEKKHPWTYRSTLLMYKSAADTSRTIITFRHSVDNTSWQYNAMPVKGFDAQVNFGAGFLRDRLAPVAELGVVYMLPRTRSQEMKFLLGLYVSGYFAFAKNGEGSYTMQDNYFVNAEFGDEGGNDFINALKTSRLTLGLGYLVSQKGDYFKGTTMKAFMNLRLQNGFTFSPEVIATDNFRQVFPGFTVKIF